MGEIESSRRLVWVPNRAGGHHTRKPSDHPARPPSLVGASGSVLPSSMLTQFGPLARVSASTQLPGAILVPLATSASAASLLHHRRHRHATTTSDA